MEAHSIVYKSRPKRKNYKDTGQDALNRGRAERRERLLVERRRISLNEVQNGPNMENVAENPAGPETAPKILPSGPVKRQPTGMEDSKKRAATKRIEQLREWKKERELVKRRAKEKSKKPFIPPGLNYSSTARLNTTSVLSTSSLPTSAARKPESSVAATRSGSSGLSLRNRTVKPPVPEKPIRLKRGTGFADGEKEPSRKARPPVVAKPARLKSAGSNSSSSSTNKSTLCNGSVRGPGTRVRVGGGKPVAGRNTKPSSPPSSRAAAKVDTVSKVTKVQVGGSKRLSPENDGYSQVDRKSSEVMASPKVSTRTPTSRPPLAPKPSAKVLGQKVITVNDPAWIPGQKFATPAPTDSSIFDRTFGKNQLFSPYVFTGGKKKNPALPELPGFTFKLPSVDSPDFSMGEDGDVADVSTASVTAIANDSTASLDNVGVFNISDSSQEKVNATISHNNEVANRLVAADDENAAVPPNACPESPADKAVNLESPHRSNSKDNAWNLTATNLVDNSLPGSVTSLPSGASKSTVDAKPDPIQVSDALSSSRSQGQASANTSAGQQNEAESTKETDCSFFRNLHDDVCRRWQLDCDKWNKISAELESQQLASEEALDLIRTTVCQSQLLMRSKLKQYLGLVTQAEEKTGEKIPTAEDLQGFWDMVYLQVEDIDKKFSSLDELKANNWQLPKVTTSKPKTSKPRRSKRLATATSPQSSNSQAVSDRLKQQRAKRAAARSKFLQMKAASAAAVRRDSASDLDMEKVDEKEATSPGTPVHMQKTNHFVVQTPDNTTASDCPDEVDGAFMRKYVSIKPTKKLQEMLGTDCILSPAKRSLRIHRKSVGQGLAVESPSNNSIVVTSLSDLPHNLDYVIHPNPSLQ